MRLIHPPFAYMKKSSPGFTEVSIFAMSNGGAFFSTGVDVAAPDAAVASADGAGGMASPFGLSDLCKAGGGVLPSGGDFCGSLCARTVAAVNKLRRRIFRIRQRKARTPVLSNVRSRGETGGAARLRQRRDGKPAVSKRRENRRICDSYLEATTNGVLPP